MNKLSRILLILMSVFLLAIYIPKFYWMIFKKQQRFTRINYSPIKKDFFFAQTEYQQMVPKMKFWDRAGNKYTQDQHDELLPLTNYRLLAAKGIMPDTIDGQYIDLKEVSRTNSTYRLRSVDFETPQIQMYPLFESKPARLKLEFNPDYFRFTNRMEFINCYTGEINLEKTNLFTDALKQNNCVFPIKKVFGNPTTRKPFDEGYFILDDQNQMFHIKMIEGAAFCKNIQIPSDLKIRALLFSEKPLKEFYGVLVTKDNLLYLVSYNSYNLIKIDLPEYDYFESVLYIRTNLMYRKFQILNDDLNKFLVLDNNYQYVDSYEVPVQTLAESSAGIISSALFPVQFYVQDSARRYIDIYHEFGSIFVILSNVIFLLLTIFIYRIRNINLGRNWIDFLIILIFGLFGFITLFLFRPIED